MSQRNSRAVVYDIDYAPFMENRAFDAELMSQYPGATAIARLAQRLAEAGVDMVTSDVYLREDPGYDRAVVCSNEVTRFTHTLLFERGLRGAVCVSGESPIIAWRFYTDLPTTSQWFDDLVLFPGARSLAATSARFHDFSWPYPDFDTEPGKPWSERLLLALVSGNKRAFGWPRPAFDLRHPKPSLGRWYRAAQARAAQRRHAWLQSELYIERLKAITYFGERDGFDLYGRGWNDPTSGAGARTQAAIKRSYRGEIPAHDKVKVLTNYRFALCFENTSFPGYLTEKIFDCFVAGVIPVYLGAPDVDELVPRTTYIDFRDFPGYARLEAHLRAMTPESAEPYLRAARDFLDSDEARRYSEERYVDRLAALLLGSLERGQ